MLCAEPAELRFEPAQIVVAVSFQDVTADQDDVGVQGVNLGDESIEESIICDLAQVEIRRKNYFKFFYR